MPSVLPAVVGEGKTPESESQLGPTGNTGNNAITDQDTLAYPSSTAESYLPEPSSPESHSDNKWSRNGFGHPCQSGGKFTSEESKRVREAIEAYCAAKNITTARLCSECNHVSELKGAW